jgi:hypothetical protein
VRSCRGHSGVCSVGVSERATRDRLRASARLGHSPSPPILLEVGGSLSGRSHRRVKIKPTPGLAKLAGAAQLCASGSWTGCWTPLSAPQSV